MTRHIARAVTYTLIAAIVAMSLSVTWTAGLFWRTMLVVAAVGIIILIAQWFKVSAELDYLADALTYDDDDHIQDQVNRYHCAGHGCYMQVTDTTDGTTWTCATCKRTEWTPPMDVPFDQTQESA